MAPSNFRFRDSRDAEKSFKTRWTMAPSHFRFRDSRDAEKSFKTRWTMAPFTFPMHDDSRDALRVVQDKDGRWLFKFSDFG
ncbi:hypothetical protein AVEN_214711-1 [Araneus ventricosus]|uniref:Uncharacterized protein n=1 Tax=Araneus ventricosus TaxID=182803 RepID=A0A4Y2VF27_ARAVE|nr:hypothetical protein AVEN_214711-1 [Araneus ventricosus]